MLVTFTPGLFIVYLTVTLGTLSGTLFSNADSTLACSDLGRTNHRRSCVRISTGRCRVAGIAGTLNSLADLLRGFLNFSKFCLLDTTFRDVSTLTVAHLRRPVIARARTDQGRRSLQRLPTRFTRLVRSDLQILHSYPSIKELVLSDTIVDNSGCLDVVFFRRHLMRLKCPASLLFLPLLFDGLTTVLNAR